MRTLRDVVFNQTPLMMPVTASVQAAAEAMAMKRVGSVTVLSAVGQLAGMFTGRDAIKRVLAKGLDAAKTKLGDVMTTPVVTMGPEKTAIDALRLMWHGDFRHLPIVHNGKVLGIVTRGDFSGVEQDRFDDERDLWEHMR
jgi:CBS domain-containing protein